MRCLRRIESRDLHPISPVIQAINSMVTPESPTIQYHPNAPPPPTLRDVHEERVAPVSDFAYFLVVTTHLPFANNQTNMTHQIVTQTGAPIINYTKITHPPLSGSRTHQSVCPFPYLEIILGMCWLGSRY
jgi:hypothetical protein